MKATNLWKNLWPVILAVALLVATEAGASQIVLSDASSEAAIAADLLDATLDFDVSGENTLTLTVTNDSSGYDLMAIFFNASSAVSGLSLADGPRKWKLVPFSESGAGFGTFEFAVAVQKGKERKDHFDAGDTAVFVFGIAASGIIDALDFTGELSATESGGVAKTAAAKFSGPSGSVVGATGGLHTPEPSTALLLGLGIGLLAIGVDRKKT